MPKKKTILSLFIRWMLNDVALFDRIYIRALIFLQLLRESFFQTIMEAGV